MHSGKAPSTKLESVLVREGRHRRGSVLLSILPLLTLIIPGFTQTQADSLVYVHISDAKGQGIPKVKIDFKADSVMESIETESNGTANLTLPPGRYVVMVNKPAFKPAKVANFMVGNRVPAILNLTLGPAGPSIVEPRDPPQAPLLSSAPFTETIKTSTPSGDFSITLERVGCLGTCPDYTVTILGDGTVKYEGQAYVRAEGLRNRTIPVSAVHKLIERLKNDGFLQWDEEKKMCVDFPEVHITASLEGRQKRVLEGCNRPGQVLRLADEIDKISGAREWTEKPR
jgi:hypothetical protein